MGSHSPQLGSWTQVNGTWQIDGNAVHMQTTSGDASLVHDTGQIHHNIRAKFSNFSTAGNSAYLGVIVRYLDPTHYYLVTAQNRNDGPDSTNMLLWFRDGGSWTHLVECPHAWANGDVVTVKANGDCIHVFVNGVSKLFYKHELTLNGGTGVGLYSSSTAPSWDEVSAESYDRAVANEPFVNPFYNYLFPVFFTYQYGSVQMFMSNDMNAWKFPISINCGTRQSGDYSPIFHEGFWMIAASDTRVWLEPITTLTMFKSSDLTNWTRISLDVSATPGVAHCSAPNWFVDSDGSLSLIYQSVNSSSIGDFYRIVYNHNGTFGAPILLDTSSFPGDIYIDIFVVKKGSTYWAYVKNEDTLMLEVATAPSLDGPYTLIRTGDWNGWGAGFEGSFIRHMGGTTWRWYTESYLGDNGYHYSESTDDMDTWGPRIKITCSTTSLATEGRGGEIVDL